jgi:hypothetical protein
LVEGRITHFLFPWKLMGPLRWEEFKSKRVIQGRPREAPGWDH